MNTYCQQRRRRSPTNEARVLRQRQYEAARNNKLEEIREYEKLMHRAAFDESCDALLYRRHAHLQAMHSSAAHVLSLDSRRSKLKRLLQEEEDQLRLEIDVASMSLLTRSRSLLKLPSIATSCVGLPHPISEAESSCSRDCRHAVDHPASSSDADEARSS